MKNIECNVGDTEKIVRVIIGLVAAFLGFTVNPLFYIIAAIALVTAAISFCPVSKMLGINTCGVKKEDVLNSDDDDDDNDDDNSEQDRNNQN